MASEPIIVQAIYQFKGTNNDELCFKKGDLITITQKDEGWWEGTLNGKTGWFPSNYVRETKDSLKTIALLQNQYKEVVLKDIIDSEKAHVTELENLVTNYLQPLEKSGLLSIDEYKQLTGNILIVLEIHQQLLSFIEVEESKPSADQKVGRLFLNWSQQVKNIHQIYCSLHPRAVCILDKYREELTKFMESKGASSPGILVLTTLLSKPFRRLEKYSALLQELERHVEEFHSDRGDIQRSVAIYKDIAASCAATRRQKELELQVLTGAIRNWEGPSLATLGDIIYMGSVAVGPQHNDKYFVLFPATLVILSLSQRLSGFIYEGKLPLSSLNVTRLEDTDTYKNAFEISTNMTENKIAVCQSKEEANHWFDVLKKTMLSRGSNVSDLSHKISPSQAQFVPQPPPHLNQRGYSNRTSIFNLIAELDYTPTYPPENYPSTAPFYNLTKLFHKLVKQKRITSKLLKQLLYPEYLNKMNLSLVKIRHHKTECVIATRDIKCRNSIIRCDSDTEEDESSSDSDNIKMKRQDAVCKTSSSNSSEDDDSSNSSNPFGYIRYYNPALNSNIRIETKYESIIDYGNPLTEESNKIEIVLETKSKDFVKQNSETSEASSTCPVKPSLACEDLVNLNESLELNSMSVSENYIPLTRQSCPTKLVGNNFNRSSMTSIYIPSYSNSDNNLASKTNFSRKLTDNESERSSTTTTHSSSLELPVNVIPLPDKMIAELLYNFDSEESVDSSITDHSSKTVIKPPSMFRNPDQTTPVLQNEALSLNLNSVGFKKHSIDSDKPKRRSSIQMDSPYFRNNHGATMRRSVSSRFLQMAHEFDSYKKACCHYCRNEFHSPRSSDSGMAGSCTLNSPDLGSGKNQERCSLEMANLYQSYNDLSQFHASPRNVISLTDVEARNFESQCHCVSPFSTPRTSSITCMTENKITRSQCSSLTPALDLCGVQSNFSSQSSITSIRMSGGFRNNPILLKSKSTACLSNRASPNLEAVNVAVAPDEPVLYKSSLYAHWWLKAKIPGNVLESIYKDSRSPATDVTSSGGVKPKQVLGKRKN